MQLRRAAEAGSLGLPFDQVMYPSYAFNEENLMEEYDQFLHDVGKRLDYGDDEENNDQDDQDDQDENAVAWIHKRRGVENSEGITLFSWKDLKKAREERGDEGHAEFLSPGVLQRYLQNPRLLLNRKTDLRFYILVSAVAPLTAFTYPQYVVRRSPKDYDPNAKGKGALTAIDLKKGDTISDLQWSPRQLAELLKKEGRIEDVDQFMASFESKLKILGARLLRSIKDSLTTQTGFYGLYGMDVLVDEELTPRFSEMNMSPDHGLINSGPWKREFQEEMLRETAEIQMEVIKYRMEEDPQASDLMKFIRPVLKNWSPLVHAIEGSSAAAGGTSWWYDAEGF